MGGGSAVPRTRATANTSSLVANGAFRPYNDKIVRANGEHESQQAMISSVYSQRAKSGGNIGQIHSLHS